MKKAVSLLMLLASLPAFAGPSAKEVIPSPPPPSPDLWTWFAGGSVGYLFDHYDEPIYSLHTGVDTPWSPAGWNVSLFLEVAYTEPNDSTRILDSFQTVPSFVDLDVDLKIIPLTLNVKFERPIGNNLSVYFGAGVGVAFVDLDMRADFLVSPDLHESDDDTVFAAQAFVGLVYNFNEHAEVYTDVKWLYLDDADKFPLEDDFIAEVGFRWNF